MNPKFDLSYLKRFTRNTQQSMVEPEKEEESSDSENLDLIGQLNLNDDEHDVPQRLQNKQQCQIQQVTPQKHQRSHTFYSSGSSVGESDLTQFSGHPPMLNISMSGSSVGKEDMFYKTMPTTFQQFQFKRKFEPQASINTFQIIIPNIESDLRTTLMIKNIPNKYTQPLLLEKLDRNHKDAYDFFYLPIDFINKCNVGYAFINFAHQKYIKAFYIEYHGKKWDMFNSDKVCQITYARIQGVEQLQNHFQYSTIMMEKDRRMKPLFRKHIQDLMKKKK